MGKTDSIGLGVEGVTDPTNSMAGGEGISVATWNEKRTTLRRAQRAGLEWISLEAMNLQGISRVQRN